jgi:hypothetical protein
MSADTNALHRPVPKVTKLEYPEEDFVAENSPIRDYVPG